MLKNKQTAILEKIILSMKRVPIFSGLVGVSIV